MTRQLKIVYLKPLSGYKTSLRSDTLWGLLCWGIRHLYGEQRLEAFLRSYTEGSPEWIISSTFPYKHDGKKRIPFFPKPFLPDTATSIDISEKDKLRLRKKVKKMSWLEHSDFEKTLKGELTQKDFLEQAQQEIPLDASKVPPKVYTFEQSRIMRNLSLKLDDKTFEETEKILETLQINRNRYINKALSFYNHLQKRKQLAARLASESQLVRTSR